MADEKLQTVVKRFRREGIIADLKPLNLGDCKPRSFGKADHSTIIWKESMGLKSIPP
jgi:hypothetical protein